MENWKQIPGYSAYEVSDKARVRRKSSGKIMRQYKGNHGYWSLRLCGDDQIRLVLVHVVMLLAFKGHPAVLNHVGRHLDDNADNNSLDNLAWGTRYDNAMDAKRNGRWIEGEKHGHAKLTDAMAMEVYRRANAGERTSVLAREFGVSPPQVSDIKHKKQWVHIHAKEAVACR